MATRASGNPCTCGEHVLQHGLTRPHVLMPRLALCILVSIRLFAGHLRGRKGTPLRICQIQHHSNPAGVVATLNWRCLLRWESCRPNRGSRRGATATYTGREQTQTKVFMLCAKALLPAAVHAYYAPCALLANVHAEISHADCPQAAGLDLSMDQIHSRSLTKRTHRSRELDTNSIHRTRQLGRQGTPYLFEDCSIKWNVQRKYVAQCSHCTGSQRGCTTGARRMRLGGRPKRPRPNLVSSVPGV